jgi:predicted dehydrogenase
MGVTGDLGVHKADLLRWLLGQEFTEVGAILSTLDKRDAPAFTLRDMELMAVFANQAAAAIAASRVQRELPALVRTALASAAGGELDDAALEALVDAACRDLDRE